MAEPVGLALGTVALVSLFSSCVELVNYFELGKSYQYDYSVACLKLSLLRARLESWGDTLRVRDSGHEAKALPRDWSREQDVVERSLMGIKNIFGDAEILKDKYKLIPRTSKNLSRSQEARNKPASASQEPPLARYFGNSRHFSLFRQSTKWAIRDKDRFDALLHDLEFFISNLEHVQSRLKMSQNLTKDAEVRRGGEGAIKISNTTLQGEQKSRDQVQSRLVAVSNSEGRISEPNGRQFKINKTSGNAMYFQGVNGKGPVTGPESGRGDSFTVDEMTDESTGMQGENSTQAMNAMLESRRAMLADQKSSVRSNRSTTDEQKSAQSLVTSNQSTAGEQRQAQFNGKGRVLGK